MPEGLSFGFGFSPAARAASGGRPRVTVHEMSALRFSFSFSINSRFFATNVSSFAVSASRKSAIATLFRDLAKRGGNGILFQLIVLCV